MNEQRFYNELKGIFCLRTNKSKKPQMIYFVVYIDGVQYKLSCGVKVYPSQWYKGIAEESNRLSKLDNNNNKMVNDKLSAISSRFSAFKSYLCNCNDKVTDMGGLLKQYIYDKVMTKKINVCGLFDEAFDSYYKNRNTKESSIEDYKRKLEKFKEYVKGLAKPEIVLNQKGFMEWWKWLKENSADSQKNPTMELVFRLLKNIRENHSDLKLSFFDMPSKVQPKNTREEKREGKPLSKEEVEAIAEYEPKNNNEKKAKLFFLIGCYSGVRSCDYIRLQKSKDEIKGGYEKKVEEGKLYYVIKPKKTDRNKQKKAIITITPELHNVLEEAKEYIYQARGASEELKKYIKDKDKRLLTTTYTRLLRNICKSINKANSLLFSKKVRVDKKNKKTGKMESCEVPAYEAISAHWGRHTFVHQCKLNGILDEQIAEKIGDEVEMVKNTYGYLNTDERVKKMNKMEKEVESVKNERNINTIKDKASCLLNGLFAYDDIMGMIDLQKFGANIYRSAKLKNVVFKIKRTFKINEWNNIIKAAKNENLDRVKDIDMFIWNISRYFCDANIYMIYQYKLEKLGLLDRKKYTEEDLHMIWEQEDADAEAYYYSKDGQLEQWENEQEKIKNELK